MTNLSLKNIVELNDVVVMTPQILLNALDSGELPSLSVFTLLIFDECHHTRKHYPYNDILSRYYVDEKLVDSRLSRSLPQVCIGYYEMQALTILYETRNTFYHLWNVYMPNVVFHTPLSKYLTVIVG